MDPFEGLGDIIKKRKGELVVVDEKVEKKMETKQKTKKEDIGDQVDAILKLKPPPKRKRVKSVLPLIRVPKKQKTTKQEEKKRSEKDRKSIALLTQYGKNEWLGPYLKDSHGFDLTPVKLRKFSASRLAETLADVEEVLANKSNSAIGDGLVRGTMYQLEMMAATKTKFNLVGTTDRCFENDHWRFLLERIKMQYGVGFGKMDPVAELTMITFQTAAMLHYSNSIQVPETDLDAVIEDQ